MKRQVYGQLTLFPEDFPASHFPSPGSSEARTMTVTSGQRCLESYESYGPLGCLVRMCLESSIWHSTRCLLTWKISATPRKRSIFQLAVLTPRTSGTESQFWPTPTSTGAALCGGTGNFKTLARMAEKGMITEEERRQLSQGNGGKTNPGLLEWLMGYEQKFTEMIPTPRASDYKGAASDRFYTHTHKRVPKSALRAAGSHAAWDNWPVEPGIPRVVDGISHRVDRIRCLGNAVVPQQFYPFFAAIAEIERSKINDM